MNPNNRGRRRTVSHEFIVAFAKTNPSMLQKDIAKHFKLTQSRISSILRAAGVTGLMRGRIPVAKPGQDDLEAHWERVLHSYGLGVDRGMRLGGHRILYGYDPVREVPKDDSATYVPTFQPFTEDVDAVHQ